MGLLKKIGKVAAVAASPATAALFGGLALAKGKEHDPQGLNQANDYASQSAALQNRLGEQAQDYRSKLPEYKSNAFNAAQDSGRQDLAQQMAGIDSASNRRGLLYSGLNQGAKQGAASKYASDMSQKQYDIGQEQEGIATGMENDAIGAGFQNLAIQRGGADTAYQAALAQRQSQNAMYGNLFGALGSVGGAALANRSPGTQAPMSEPSEPVNSYGASTAYRRGALR